MAKRVYFAFHYQDVAELRANVVRKHNFTQGVEKAGYYDASIWEESKKKGDLALKPVHVDPVSRLVRALPTSVGFAGSKCQAVTVIL